MVQVPPLPGCRMGAEVGDGIENFKCDEFYYRRLSFVVVLAPYTSSTAMGSSLMHAFKFIVLRVNVEVS